MREASGVYLSQTINPVAFSLGPISIHWYGIILGTAALVGLWLATREGKKHGFDSDLFLDMMIWVLPAAIVGARLYYVLFQWQWYAEEPWKVIAVWEGGLAIHGGLIGAVVAGYFFVRKRGVPFMQVADIVAPSIILGQAIGRWGNFMNQEAHGSEVSRSFLEGLFLPDWIIEQMYIQGSYYHPTFLYESLWNIAGFALLLAIRHFNPRRGEIFISYVIWYSLGRFYIEGLRTDSLAFQGPDWLVSVMEICWLPMATIFEPGAMVDGNVRIAQLMSLILVFAGIILLAVRRGKGYADVPYLTVEPHGITVTESHAQKKAEVVSDKEQDDKNSKEEIAEEGKESS
ncbi:prolipoprotein diacylglyceryl transferase [Mechercharimyces sp. CAU 1602]|uniref:prolipoprotein diacylglyceryl transferase n=1 Tax=Mechercharimyces sp. CAU 1602 TaxID=2973933 RepID=UPI0037C8408A